VLQLPVFIDDLTCCIELNYTSRSATQLVLNSTCSYQDAVSISDAELDYTSD